MTVELGWWLVPTFATVVLAIYLFIWPYDSQGDYDFGSILRVVWVIPVCILWIIYLALK